MDNDPIFALKRQVATAIVTLAEPMRLQTAARRLGIDQARMCDLRKGRYQRFSLERLIRLLNTVDRTVTLEIAPTRPGKIDWTPKLAEWRASHPLTKLRMAEAALRRARNRDIERRLALSDPMSSEAARLAAELDAELAEEFGEATSIDDG